MIYRFIPSFFFLLFFFLLFLLLLLFCFLMTYLLFNIYFVKPWTHTFFEYIYLLINNYIIILMISLSFLLHPRRLCLCSLTSSCTLCINSIYSFLYSLICHFEYLFVQIFICLCTYLIIYLYLDVLIYKEKTLLIIIFIIIFIKYSDPMCVKENVSFYTMYIMNNKHLLDLIYGQLVSQSVL